MTIEEASAELGFVDQTKLIFKTLADMELTVPGGRIVFSSKDNAEYTDWIRNALNGYTLRLSRSGKLYVEDAA